jgi:hypothetical protein
MIIHFIMIMFLMLLRMDCTEKGLQGDRNMLL